MIGAPMEKHMTLDAGPDASRDGHFGWYRALDKQERRAFWSCKIGYGLDGMDTQMLSFVIPTLIALWGSAPAKPASSTP